MGNHLLSYAGGGVLVINNFSWPVVVGGADGTRFFGRGVGNARARDVRWARVDLGRANVALGGAVCECTHRRASEQTG